MQIRDLKNPWRNKWQTATFRGAMFFVETGSRGGGRRVALHEYPKRNVPYAEDMGRSAVRFMVTGYLIGPTYLDLRDRLTDALEKDGPGLLRMPLPFRSSDVNVMVRAYNITESRERGGYCVVEMDFIEYGDPSYRQTTATDQQIMSSATAAEDTLIGPPTPAMATEAAPFAEVHSGAMMGHQ